MNKEPQLNNLDLPEAEPAEEAVEATPAETTEATEVSDIPSEELEVTEEALEATDGTVEASGETIEATDEQENAEEGENTPVDEKKSEKNGAFNALRSLFDYVEILSIAILAVLLIFTFGFRLCRVDGRSMNHTLANGELLITTNLFYEPQQGDIIVFHLSNGAYEQPLVKRVIADEGQRVEIDFINGTVKVDGAVLDEEYIYLDGGTYQPRDWELNDQYLLKDEEGNIIGFDATVPEGHIFAMGDNRNHSTDSRATKVGFVDKDCILGKALVRLAPFTVFN